MRPLPQVVGSPLGATMLKYLNSRVVEGAMAVTLLVAIAMQCNAAQIADRVARRLWRWSRIPAGRCARRGEAKHLCTAASAVGSGAPLACLRAC